MNFLIVKLKSRELRHNAIGVLFIIAICFGSSESADFGVFIFTKLTALLLPILVYLTDRRSRDQEDTASLKTTYIWNPAAVQSGYEKHNTGQQPGGIVRDDQDSSETEKEVFKLGYSDVIDGENTTSIPTPSRHVPAKRRRKTAKPPKNELADKQLSLW